MFCLYNVRFTSNILVYAQITMLVSSSLQHHHCESEWERRDVGVSLTTDVLIIINFHKSAMLLHGKLIKVNNDVRWCLIYNLL